MFNLLRLFGRKNDIDDTATAYIEGRATERERNELRERASREPGLIEDLDSIRQTVSLLRAIEPVSAPRSFALSEAPVQVKLRRQRLAMAPAVFAIAAALAVGLLAAGNLTDIVRQSNASESDSKTSQEIGLSEPAFDPTAPGRGAESNFFDDTSDLAGAQAERTVATQGPFAAQATSVPASTPEQALDPGISSGLAPPPDTGEEDRFSGTAQQENAALAPDTSPPGPPAPSGSQETVPGAGETLPIAPSGTPLPADSRDGGAGAIEPIVPPGVPGDVLPLPQATVGAGTGPIPSAEVLDSEQPGAQPGAQPDQSGFALPLWQLQVGFAAFAVLMAGAWIVLQRRLTAVS